MRASSAGVDAVTFTSPGSPVPTGIAVFAGNAQSGPAGSPLPNPLAARVVDAGEAPLQGVTVRWVVVSGNGQIEASTTTDVTGIALAHWPLGAELLAAQRVEARVDGVAAPAVFTATATVPPVTNLSRVAGDGQTQTIYTAVPVSPTVRVTLPDGRPLGGVTVTWATSEFESTVAPANSVTGSDGRAQTTWQLGHDVGTQTLNATALGRTVSFVATAVPLLHIVSGDNQASTAFAPAKDSLVVRMARVDGTPIPGVSITWIRMSGSQGVVNPTNSVTDAQGLARTSYTMGTFGPQTVTARTPVAYHNTFVVFNETGLKDAVITKVSGDAQTGVAGQTLADSIRVRVLTGDGRPVPGAVLVPSGPTGTWSPARTSTDAQGDASFAWTLGTGTVGQQTVTVASSVFGINTVFTATATAPPP